MSDNSDFISVAGQSAWIPGWFSPYCGLVMSQMSFGGRGGLTGRFSPWYLKTHQAFTTLVILPLVALTGTSCRFLMKRKRAKNTFFWT